MTRENLLQAIYDNTDEWSCAYSCPHTMEEENPKDVCMKCAERLLTEYEQQVRAEVIDEIFDKAYDADMDSSLIYLRFDKEEFNVPFMSRKIEVEEWLKEKLKEHKQIE